LETIALIINGIRINCQAGSRLLEVAEKNGIPVPHLCSHPSLHPVGACRLCLVEDEKTGRLMAACVTPAAQDMQILTHTPRIERHRRNIVRLMMAEHPESCIVCNKGNRCELRGVAAQLGIGATNLYPMPNYKPLEQANPFIVRDLSKCILCGKCIRADHELVVVGAIDFYKRGFKSRPATLHDLPLEQSNCTFCGTCISICPTGALSLKSDYAGTPERTAPSICGFCGVGCSLSLGMAGEKIVEVNPDKKSNTVNGATLCVRGRFAMDFLNSNDRLTQPLVRENGNLIPLSWDKALDLVARRLFEIKETHGSQSIAFIGSSKCSNEENYLFQKIARVFLKTNNIDNGGYLFGRQLLSMVEKRTDKGGRFNFFAGSLSGIEKAEVIMVIGADPCHTVPVAGYYLKRAAAKGIPILLIDPRQTDLSKDARIILNPTPGSDLALINALSALLCRRGTCETSFIERFTKGFGAYSQSLNALDLNQAAGDTGLCLDDLEKAADLLAGKKITFVVGRGISKQRQGEKIMDALLNLAMMTSSIGYAGAGFHITTGESNIVGSWYMGTVPDALPGRRLLCEKKTQKEWEAVWGAELSLKPGLNMLQMIEAAEKGLLKAVYIMGENPLRALQEPERVRKAFERIPFIVCQDILQTETTAAAHIVLPGAAVAEKEGTFTNMEGRLQQFSPAILPPGDSRPDFEILSVLSQKMSGSPHPLSLDDIREEISRVLPMHTGNTQSSHLVWIKDFAQKDDARAEKPDSSIEPKFSDVFPLKRDTPDSEYPFTALLGSDRYHLGSGTRTSRSYRIATFENSAKIEPKQRAQSPHSLKYPDACGGELQISLADAECLALKDGDAVRLTSKWGAISRAVRIQKRLSKGLVYVPGAYNHNDARCLIPLTPLFSEESSGWNYCRVKIEKI
jgi:formate dehydrogenase alpha subunit